jgi:hypothetical protein
MTRAGFSNYWTNQERWKMAICSGRHDLSLIPRCGTILGMTGENIFRWVLLAGLVVVLLVGAYHRLRWITKERLDRRQEGWFVLITLRLAGVGTMVGTIGYVVIRKG